MHLEWLRARMALLPCAPMRIDDFDYHLPDSLIAKFPPAERRDSRLLDLSDGIADRHFFDLPKILKPGDLMVFNDTRVIPARLYGRKSSGGRIELLVERTKRIGKNP